MIDDAASGAAIGVLPKRRLPMPLSERARCVQANVVDRTQNVCFLCIWNTRDQEAWQIEK